MCKEMPVIPVNKVVDPKRIIGKMPGRGGGGEAQGVTDPPKRCSCPRCIDKSFETVSKEAGYVGLQTNIGPIYITRIYIYNFIQYKNLHYMFIHYTDSGGQKTVTSEC
jgi:hypothetical protein